MRRDITYTHVRSPVTGALRRAKRERSGDTITAARYRVMLGLLNVTVDDRWVAVERFAHLIAATS